jgi:hypothetical protein
MSPEELLELARGVVAKPPKLKGMMRYARAMEVLRRKGFTWASIAEWFNEQGIPVKHPQSLAATLRKWGKTPDYLEFCAQEDKESELNVQS